ncbi:hypothetical protein [Streptomyces zaomyceticus]|uniref:hypothetical protein n=1 Tax=Streptomyces zaomyceticus TaxID=68286 RepID=UPI001679B358|nr:hypothetical protein [Streptomyces zaomyceticus]GHG24846.1 hypothetical protein GCM10018791_45650 [Streptomyces zaomyceticus]
MDVADLSLRRIKVLELRLRIERVSFGAYKLVSKPDRPPTVSNGADAQLAFVLGLVGQDRYGEVLGVIRLSRHIYKKSSDILHGRSGLLNASSVVLDEWELVVSQLEGFLDQYLEGPEVDGESAIAIPAPAGEVSGQIASR